MARPKKSENSGRTTQKNIFPGGVVTILMQVGQSLKITPVDLDILGVIENFQEACNDKALLKKLDNYGIKQFGNSEWPKLCATSRSAINALPTKEIDIRRILVRDLVPAVRDYMSIAVYEQTGIENGIKLALVRTAISMIQSKEATLSTPPATKRE